MRFGRTKFCLSALVTWIAKRGGVMGMIRKKETIPEHFKDDEEAGEFWDIHSAGDFWDEMEETEMEFDIKSRSG
jgi:hypothetical protein